MTKTFILQTESREFNCNFC